MPPGRCIRPGWVSDSLFPFESREFVEASGGRMHFVDEGEGEPVVFVHGNPSWSFEFRHLIAGLSGEFRCVAPDHLGFGLSSRGERAADHRPEAHARRFAALIDRLGLENMTLFMADWGGPIGLDFARRHPGRVKRIVIANSWCWPVGDDFHFRSFSFLMSSWPGQYLIKRRNAFIDRVMKMAVGKKAVLTPEVMAHYRNAQPTPEARAAVAAFPGHIVGAGGWLGEIWEDRGKFAGKPALVLWGLRDIAFRRKELARWQSALSDCEVHEFEDCGHFLAEEAPERVLPVLRAFMGGAGAPSGPAQSAPIGPG